MRFTFCTRYAYSELVLFLFGSEFYTCNYFSTVPGKILKQHNSLNVSIIHILNICHIKGSHTVQVLYDND